MHELAALIGYKFLRFGKALGFTDKQIEKIELSDATKTAEELLQKWTKKYKSGQENEAWRELKRALHKINNELPNPGLTSWIREFDTHCKFTFIILP